MSKWCLEGQFNQLGSSELFDIHHFPLSLGRGDAADRSVKEPSVSRHHANITEYDPDSLLIEDMGSSNGTFVNRQRIDAPSPIRHGDIIHLGDAELRLLDRSQMSSKSVRQPVLDPAATMMMPAMSTTQNSAVGVLELEELIEKRLLNMVYQPIVTPKGAQTIGYEVLARSAHPKLSPNPMVLFGLAETTGQEVSLSELARELGVQTAEAYKLQGELFLNTHPKELEDLDALIASLQTLRQAHPNAALVLEIHENAVTGLADLQNLKTECQTLGMKLAFDDFGVGQSRLMEIVGAKPDIIKFDRALIDGLNPNDTSRISMLRNLKNLVSDLGITALAECVSNEEEYLACECMGFDLYQGWYFGKAEGAQNVSAQGWG